MFLPSGSADNPEEPRQINLAQLLEMALEHAEDAHRRFKMYMQQDEFDLAYQESCLTLDWVDQAITLAGVGGEEDGPQ